MMSPARHARRNRILGVAGGVLLVCGVAAIIIGVQGQQEAPVPPASAGAPVAVTPSTTAPTPTPTPTVSSSASATTSATAGSSQSRSTTPAGTSSPAPRTSSSEAAPPTPTPTVTGPIMDRSQPVHLSIPAINVDSDTKTIGLTADGHIKTPPLVKNSHPFWLTVSPTPGELGPSVILGHVDSAEWGPAIFFDLGDLRPHDKISVTRADGSVAVFEVTHVNMYKKANFPTFAVYGNTDHAALRLMTCGGQFNYDKRSYESNIVVYAALVAAHDQ